MAEPEILNVKYYGYASLTFTAFNPFFPSSKSKVTSSFSLILSFKPFECTKYSFDESASLINPNPFELLKNFTVPLFIVMLFNVLQNTLKYEAPDNPKK